MELITLITQKEIERFNEIHNYLNVFGHEIAKALENVVRSKQSGTSNLQGCRYSDISFCEIESFEGKIYFNFAEYFCQSEEHFATIQIALDDINFANVNKIVLEFFESERLKRIEAKKQKELEIIEETKQREIEERKHYKKLKDKYGEFS